MPKAPRRSFELIELREIKVGGTGGRKTKPTSIGMIVQSTTPAGAAKKCLSKLCKPQKSSKKMCKYLVTIAELETTYSGATQTRKGRGVRMYRKNGDQKFFSYTGKFKRNETEIIKSKGLPGEKRITHRFKPTVRHFKLSASLLKNRSAE